MSESTSPAIGALFWLRHAARYTAVMLPEHRARLLEILARLDQLETGAGEILCEPVFPDVYVRAENVREELVEMRARVEQHLDMYNAQR